MNYVTASSVTLVCVIQPSKAAYSLASNFHAEVHSVGANTKTIINDPTVVAAVAPAGEDAGTAGSATFTIPLPTDGPYIVTVMYSSQTDNDSATAPVQVQVGRAMINKITAATTVQA